LNPSSTWSTGVSAVCKHPCEQLDPLKLSTSLILSFWTKILHKPSHWIYMLWGGLGGEGGGDTRLKSGSWIFKVMT